jgi:hypothetical protein
VPDISARELAERLIDLVEDDQALPYDTRHRAGALREFAVRNPDKAMERLDTLATEVIPSLEGDLKTPASDLAKCVGIEKFWTYHLKVEVKAFVSAATYRLRVERSRRPGRRLMDDLSDAKVLLKAPHSWLVPKANIDGLDGKQLRIALAIRHLPPYCVFVFPREQLTAHHVTVRSPSAVDAIPERLIEWRPGGLASGILELIDRDVPKAALGLIEWRP